MKDMYGNNLNVGDQVIFYSDKFYTRISEIIHIGEHSIQVMNDDIVRLFHSDTDKVPVVLVGQYFKNTSTMETLKLQEIKKN